MNDAAFVGGRERRCDFFDYVGGLHGSKYLVHHALLEIAALDELHRNINFFLALADVKDSDDMGMV